MEIKSRTRWIIVTLGFLLLAFFIWRFKGIVGYVVAAGVLSLMGNPLMKFLTELKLGKLKLGRGLSALLTIIVFFLLLTGFVLIFAPLIADQATVLSKIDYEKIGQQIEGPVNEGLEYLKDKGVIEDTGQDLESLLTENLKKVFDLNSVSNLFGNVVGFFTNTIGALFAITFILFFFLKEEGLFYNIIKGIVPDKIEDKVDSALRKVEYLLSRYFLGLALQVTLFTLLAWAGLSIIGIKNALLIAFLGGVTNLIPYIGPFIGGIMAFLITLSTAAATGQQLDVVPLIIKLAIVFGVVQLIDNILFQPIIFSNSVKAHPLEIFVVILIAGSLGGILGMIFAIPAYTIIRVLAKEFLGEFKVVKGLTKDI